ncbi:hypothetical protein [Methanococcus maripaludis]|uniref:Gas vesicle protein n=1 Tax=Methanococcus maripaludis TaxID=39152 RepID=A0A7J9PI61_METMI|nr:hypothetical protein [Methanococcus maripaludis]MBA2862923.1 gas vesicle protein [Methanococcus maripaludis]
MNIYFKIAGYMLVLGAIVAFLFICFPKSSKELKEEARKKGNG